jgi:hypothetical protein
MKPFADVRSEERSVGMTAPDHCYRRRNDPIEPLPGKRIQMAVRLVHSSGARATRSPLHKLEGIHVDVDDLAVRRRTRVSSIFVGRQCIAHTTIRRSDRQSFHVCHNKERRRWFEPAKMIQPWWRPVWTLDRQTFAADMLFNGAEEQNFRRKMPADAWFDFKGCDDRLEVEEQSFLLPNEEVMTVLKLPDEAIA